MTADGQTLPGHRGSPLADLALRAAREVLRVLGMPDLGLSDEGGTTW